ncbi:MAG: MFS transporter [Clostridia bacterium]|nr:MFS transporter [Clostridia bacterium]
MVRSLNTKWKEFLFAFSGFGPNFLMVLMGSYYSDALNPAALEAGEQLQAILPGFCFILPALFPILYALGKVFDGLIDIPFAYITDTLSTKWGRRRPAIAVCFLPMLVSFILSWVMPVQAEYSLFNTVWVFFWNLIFFASYTMCLIAFYGSLSSVCEDEPQRLRVSGYKSFFDTISYCLVYALVPVLLKAFDMHIHTLVFACTPLMLSMLIPLFLIKEGKKYGYPENEGLSPEKITLGESLRLTFKNKIFRRWLYVNCCTFFGMQMFLSGMNGMIIGGMGMNSLQMALLNTCAFAPVPIMLYLFNKSKARYGVRATYQSCLLAFAVAIMTFFLASRFVLGEGNTTLKIAIGILGGLGASWSIGAFFMMPYLAPAQISCVEERLTGKNHSAMYFAGNAVATSIVGAISGSLVYEYIKNIFLSKEKGFTWATDSSEAYRKLYGLATDAVVSAEEAATVYNFANLVVPFIVCITCVIGFFLAFKLPRDFTPAILARQFKEFDPNLDISEIETEEVKQEREEIIFVQVGLSILSGFIFGFIWTGLLLGSVRKLTGKIRILPWWLISCLIPFGQIVTIVKLRRLILDKAAEEGKQVKLPLLPLILLSCVFFILPINIITLAILQSAVNRLYREEAPAAPAEVTA